MARPLGWDTEIGMSGPPRYKARTGAIDVVKFLHTFAVVDIATGRREKHVMWERRVASGTRPDGKNWFVTLSDDPAQNFAEEIGSKIEKRGAALVLVLARFDQQTQATSYVLKPYIWAFGNDKWKKLRTMVDMLGVDAISAGEFVVSCSDDTFQKVDIFPQAEQNLMLPKLTAEQMTRVKEELGKAARWMDEHLAADDRGRQIEAITGQRVSVGALPPGVAGRAGMPPAGMNASLSARIAALARGPGVAPAGPSFGGSAAGNAAATGVGAAAEDFESVLGGGAVTKAPAPPAAPAPSSVGTAGNPFAGRPAAAAPAAPGAPAAAGASAAPPASIFNVPDGANQATPPARGGERSAEDLVDEMMGNK